MTSSNGKNPRYWPFVRGIHRSPVNSPHKGQWRGALMFSLISTLNKRCWINGKQWWGWWFETPPRQLWRHYNALTRGGGKPVAKYSFPAHVGSSRKDRHLLFGLEFEQGLVAVGPNHSSSLQKNPWWRQKNPWWRHDIKRFRITGPLWGGPSELRFAC